MAQLTTQWTHLGYAELVGSSVTINLYGKYTNQSTQNNSSSVSFYVNTGGTQGYSTTNGYINFTGTFNDGVSLINYPSYTQPGTTLLTKEATLYHNANGDLDFSLGVSAYVVIGGNRYEASIWIPSITTPHIDRYPTLIDAPNFNDEENPTITYTTTLGIEGAVVEACITDLSGYNSYASYRQINVSNGSYTFELTNAEREAIRNASVNTQYLDVKFWIRTSFSGTAYLSSLQRMVNIANASPDITYTRIETNQNVIDVLGSSDASKVIQNSSIVRFTITPVLRKGATLKSLTFTSGDYNMVKTTTPYTFDVPITTNKWKATLIDSRNYVVSIEHTMNMIEYSPVNITQKDMARANPTSSDIVLNFKADYIQKNFNNTANVPAVKWKLENGSYNTIPSNVYSIDTTNNTLTITNYTLSNALVYTSGGNFTIYIEDLLTNDSEITPVTKGIALIELGEDEVQVNGDILIADTEGTNAKSIKNRYDLIPNGNPVKAGYKIDGNDVYKKLIEYSKTTSGTTFSIPTGIVDGTYHRIWINYGESALYLYNRALSLGVNQYSGANDWSKGYTYGSTLTILLGNDYASLDMDFCIVIEYIEKVV